MASVSQRSIAKLSNVSVRSEKKRKVADAFRTRQVWCKDKNGGLVSAVPAVWG